MTKENDIIDNLIKARVNEIVDDIVIDKVDQIVTRDLAIYIKKATLDFWSDYHLSEKKRIERRNLMFEAVKELSEMRFSPLKTVIERIAENCINEKYKSFSFDFVKKRRQSRT